VLPQPVAESFVARVLAVAAVAVAAVLALSPPARGAAASPFREVAVDNGVWAIQSDGARFAWGQPRAYEKAGAVRVFDTLRGRNFQLAAPRPGCTFGSIGGGLALAGCLRLSNDLLDAAAQLGARHGRA
jgi:hypothetical protein